MKDSLKRMIYRLGVINHKIEFLVILTWMLYCPAKDSAFYFLSTAALLCFFSLRNIYFMKTWGASSFNYSLPVISLVLMVTLFFSTNPMRSVLSFADLLLVLCYFTLFYNDREKESDLYLLIAYIISALSALVMIFRYITPLSFPDMGTTHLFFVSSIHEGIISGMGVLILFCCLLKEENKKKRLRLTGFMVLNILGVYISQSKAAYLGTVIFILPIMLLKRKKWLPYLAALVVLTFIIPNPIRSMVIHSLTKDPYAADRIEIWKTGARIFSDYPVMGVGLNSFSDVSSRYNFKQTKGPANYFKVPQNTHNDYVKLIVETGIPGLAILILLFYLLSKKIFSSSLFSVSKILLLYLLFQAFIFNILFTTFFFFILMFLLKNLLEGDVSFQSFSIPFKSMLSFLLIIIFTACYVFPWLSGQWIEQSSNTVNSMDAYDLLETAGKLNPLDADVHYLKAGVMFRYFRLTSNMESFASALNHAGKAQRLRPGFVDAYMFESLILQELMNKNVTYPGMEKEIIAPLEKAEIHAPFNPFIKMRKAFIYMSFNRKEKAKAEALKALKLEPYYASALYFLQRNFNHFPDKDAFERTINQIREKNRQWPRQPGHYLYNLWQIPQLPKLPESRTGER